MDNLVTISLDRQCERRTQGIPTLTTLIGPVGVAVDAWKRSNSVRSLVVLNGTVTGLGALSGNWLTAAIENGYLRNALINLLAKSLGLTAVEIEARLWGATESDLERFLQTPLECEEWLWPLQVLLPRNGNDSADSIAQAILSDLQEQGLSIHSCIGRFAGLIPTTGPAILFLASTATFEEAACSLCALASAAPIMPVGIALPSEVAEPWLRRQPNERWLAMLHEGIVRVESVTREKIIDRMKASSVSMDSYSATIDFVATTGVTPEAIDNFVETAEAIERAQSEPEEDRARSAAERFLFNLLESMPQTAGRFQLNHRLEFVHGRALAESDLVAADHKLVVEIDGSYYHLGSKEAYRRDRRKDWLLQQHGYRVLRFLAEDVVARLEEILTTILAALEFCQST